MNAVRLGLIGLGEMGKKHFINCLHSEQIRLIAVSDLSKKALLLAKKSGIKNVYRDYVQLLENKDVEAVVISLPTFLHREAALKAAEYGKHVMVEKPLARDSTEAEDIVFSARKSGIKLMVGYPIRYDPVFASLKQRLEDGKLGDVQIAVASFISMGPFSPRGEDAVPTPVPSWWFDKNLTGGGALLDLGCHMVNLLRWYFGDIAAVQTYLGHRFNLDFEDYALCYLHFKGGTKATINVGWFARYHRIQVDLYGTVMQGIATSKVSHVSDYLKKLVSVDKSTGFYKELEYFANCVRTDTDPMTSGEDGLQDIKIISEAYKNSIKKSRATGETK